MLVPRVLSAAVAVPILLLLVWVGDPGHYPIYSAVVAVVALGAAWEFYGLATHIGQSPLRRFGLVLSLLFVVNAYLFSHFGRDFTLALLAVAVILPLVRLLRRPAFAGAVADWALTVVGALYTGGLLSYLVLLRQGVQGREWVLLTMATVFAADSTAYFVGRSLGRVRLAPQISPNKTVEGAIAGLVGGMVAMAALAPVLGLPVPLLQAVGLGLLTAVASQVGDLAESMLKRSTNVKDASHLIPGHGGLLDRVDSLVFGAVVVYYYMAIFHPS